MSFHGETKYAVGKTIRKKRCADPKLCTSDVLHASEKALDALGYARTLDCNLYIVEGDPVVNDHNKSGFFSLKVIREIPDQAKDGIFGFKYHETLHPVDPSTIESKVTDEDVSSLKAWASVWDSVCASVWASVRAYIGSLFLGIETWKYNEHEKGKYPFQPAVELWKRGFIPVKVDGKWKLYHPVKGKPAILVYEEGVQ